MASLSALGKKPEAVKNLFITKEVNKVGLYTLKLYIRGKPWLITIDDSLQFENDTFIHRWFTGVQPNALLARPSDQYPSLWALLLEKAFAKYLGT